MHDMRRHYIRVMVHLEQDFLVNLRHNVVKLFHGKLPEIRPDTGKRDKGFHSVPDCVIRIPIFADFNFLVFQSD